MLVPADDERQLRKRRLQVCDIDVLPHVQVRHADNEVDAPLLQRGDRALGRGLVVPVDVDIVANVAAVVAVQR